MEVSVARTIGHGMNMIVRTMEGITTGEQISEVAAMVRIITGTGEAMIATNVVGGTKQPTK